MTRPYPRRSTSILPCGRSSVENEYEYENENDADDARYSAQSLRRYGVVGHSLVECKVAQTGLAPERADFGEMAVGVAAVVQLLYGRRRGRAAGVQAAAQGGEQRLHFEGLGECGHAGQGEPILVSHVAGGQDDRQLWAVCVELSDEIGAGHTARKDHVGKHQVDLRPMRGPQVKGFAAAEGELVVFAWDDFLRMNGDPAVDALGANEVICRPMGLCSVPPRTYRASAAGIIPPPSKSATHTPTTRALSPAAAM